MLMSASSPGGFVPQTPYRGFAAGPLGDSRPVLQTPCFAAPTLDCCRRPDGNVHGARTPFCKLQSVNCSLRAVNQGGLKPLFLCSEG